MTKTSRYLTPEYAVATSWISQTGAMQIGVERAERVRLAASRGVAGRRDRARELRHLELVGEEPRRDALPRLERRRRCRARGRCSRAAPRRADGRRASSSAARASSARRGVATALTRPPRRGRRRDRGRSPAERTGTRRRRACTPRRRRRGRSRARVGDRHEHGVGRRAARAPSRSRRGSPTTGTPWMRRRRNAAVVVDEADHAHARRLAQLAQQAAPAAAGADDQRPLLVGRGATSAPDRVRDAALPEARDADQQRAEQDVDEERAAREAVPRRRSPQMKRNAATFGERRPRRRCSRRRARPRSARRRGRGRRARRRRSARRGSPGSDRLKTCRCQGTPVPSARMMNAIVNEAVISAKSTTHLDEAGGGARGASGRTSAAPSGVRRGARRPRGSCRTGAGRRT